jgi:hypothetical protein
MSRAPAALLAAALAATLVLMAARAHAQAAAPFPEVPLPAPNQTSYGWAYASLAVGAGLIAASFPLKNAADRAYDDYLTETDPDQIEELYDQSRRYDVWAAAALIGGEVLLATGVYLRFMRGPKASRLELAAQPGRCAVSLRF